MMVEFLGLRPIFEPPHTKNLVMDNAYQVIKKFNLARNEVTLLFINAWLKPQKKE
jgi:hypothetical protein